jgi:hypothetical protein
MRPNSLLVSAVTAPTAAILIAVVLSIFDGWKWDNPLGLAYYTVLFVLPFTLMGSFMVILPAYHLSKRILSRRESRTAVVLITSGIVGAIALIFIFEQIFTVGLIGAASGIATAIVWLVLCARMGRSPAND